MPQAGVLSQCAIGSLVELTRLAIDDFKFEDDGMAERFGLEVARMMADGYERM